MKEYIRLGLGFTTWMLLLVYVPVYWFLPYLIVGGTYMVFYGNED